MRILRPTDNIYAFYDGRTEGSRFAPEPNWVDRGALSLGIASFAIVDGNEAIVYDTHVTIGHAQEVRRALEAEGVEHFTVVLSHCHLDHVAGNEVFADCEIIANDRTAELLERDRAAIEAGTLEGPPAIAPLVLPTRTFSDRMTMTLGPLELELIHLDIHSDDATVIWIESMGTLLAGDTLEDTVTYVVDPSHFPQHLEDLGRLRALGAAQILPCHGDPEVIANGGYSPGFIDATELYVRTLMRCADDPELAAVPLRELLAEPLASGAIEYFEPYEEVHRSNLEQVQAKL